MVAPFKMRFPLIFICIGVLRERRVDNHDVHLAIGKLALQLCRGTLLPTNLFPFRFHRIEQQLTVQ